VAQLKAELAIVDEYLPKKVSAEETEKLSKRSWGSMRLPRRRWGRRWGCFMKAHGSQVDAGLANAAIKTRLAGK